MNDSNKSNWILLIMSASLAVAMLCIGVSVYCLMTGKYITSLFEFILSIFNFYEYEKTKRLL